MTITSLKILALTCMLVDHIGQFIPNTPEYFRWIGRLSAPIFIFCMVWGLAYTKNRRKYMSRMYICSLIMGIINVFLESLRYPEYRIALSNNIFSTLFLIGIIIILIEQVREDKHIGTKKLIVFSVFQILTTILIIILVDVMNILSFTSIDVARGTLATVMGNVVFCEGSIFWVALGVGLYFVKANRKSLSTYYGFFWIIYSLCFSLGLAPRVITRLQYWGFRGLSEVLRISGQLVGIDTVFGWNITCNWMMIGSLPFILLYNGKKGSGFKYFFYLFYPLHIWILYILGNFILKYKMF